MTSFSPLDFDELSRVAAWRISARESTTSRPEHESLSFTLARGVLLSSKLIREAASGRRYKQ